MIIKRRRRTRRTSPSFSIMDCEIKLSPFADFIAADVNSVYDGRLPFAVLVLRISQCDKVPKDPELIFLICTYETLPPCSRSRASCSMIDFECIVVSDSRESHNSKLNHHVCLRDYVHSAGMRMTTCLLLAGTTSFMCARGRMRGARWVASSDYLGILYEYVSTVQAAPRASSCRTSTSSEFSDLQYGTVVQYRTLQ